MTPIHRRALLAAPLLATPALALAQSSRPVTIIVPFPAGGEPDVLARVYAERLAPRIGRNVVVENRAGASGTIGTGYVGRAAPDGDTLLLAPNTFAIAPHVLRRSQTYDPTTDFTPIIQVGTNALLLMAGRQSGLRSLEDLLVAARAGRVTTYGSPGSGSPMNILAELFNRAAGLQLTEVAYRGTAPLLIDLLGGVVPIGYITPALVGDHLRTGALAGLAVSSRERAPLVPDVPTFIERGFDVEVTAWYGMFAPRGLAPAMAQTLNQHMNTILELPEVAERMRGLGIQRAGGPASRLAEVVAADSARYGRLVREFNISAE
jgi:tripartite-type tricarboxylate transporter receptor subunit TctC